MLASFASHRVAYCLLGVRRHADLTNTAGAWATAVTWHPNVWYTSNCTYINGRNRSFPHLVHDRLSNRIPPPHEVCPKAFQASVTAGALALLAPCMVRAQCHLRRVNCTCDTQDFAQFMSTPVEVFARSNSLSDTDSVLSLQPYSSESAESEEDDASTADLNPAPASAFARLKSLLQQRDSQLSTDQQERSSEPPLAEASERQLLTVQRLCIHLLRSVYEAVTSVDCLISFFSAQLDLELSQSENWSIKAAQPDDLLEEASEASLGCNESFAADTQQYAQAPKSALAESPAKLLQFQAQEAADRAAQRQRKQQQVLLLQQALARQQHAAGRHHTAFPYCGICFRVLQQLN